MLATEKYDGSVRPGPSEGVRNRGKRATARCGDICTRAFSCTDDGSSVSIADMPLQKKDPGALDSKWEMPSRPQEIGLFFATLGRNSILTWSHLMIKTPIAIAAGTSVGTFVCATGVGTIEL